MWPLKMVEIETYTACNRRCVYCPNSDHERPPHFMPDMLFDRIIDELATLGFCGRMSYHFYNEPLLDPRLATFVRSSRQRLPSIRIVLYSNGDLMTRARFEELVDAGIDVAWVTNHGSSIRHCDWRDQLSEPLRAKLRYQTNKNPDIFWTNRGGLLPLIANVTEPLSEVCTAPATTLVVNAFGHVVLCYEDYEGREVLGDLNTQSITDVWMAPKTVRIREALMRGDRTCSVPCRSCNNIEMQTFDVID